MFIVEILKNIEKYRTKKVKKNPNAYIFPFHLVMCTIYFNKNGCYLSIVL